MGCTIDEIGLVGLKNFVDGYHPEFPIGALDGPTSQSFGQWGPRRLLVPQVYMIDKGTNVTGQFMGSDVLFEGDRVGNLRAAINHMIGVGGPSKQLSPVKNPVAKKK